MEKNKMKTSIVAPSPRLHKHGRQIHRLLFHLQICALLFLCCYVGSIISYEEEEEAVGYGYSIQSIHHESSIGFLAADLQLIKNSSIFGPDIPHLSLTARLVLQSIHL